MSSRPHGSRLFFGQIFGLSRNSIALLPLRQTACPLFPNRPTPADTLDFKPFKLFSSVWIRGRLPRTLH